MAERTSVSDGLLRVIARRLAEQIGYAPEGKYTLALEEWLREMGVGRLLEAGQAMRDDWFPDVRTGAPAAWDAAKAEVMGEPER